MKQIAYAVCLLLAVLYPHNLSAQEDGTKDNPTLTLEAAELLAKTRLAEQTAREAGEAASDLADPSAPPSQFLRDLRFLLEEFYATPESTETAETAAFRTAFTQVFTDSMAKSMAAHFDYRTQNFDHRARTFEWQLQSARIIFFTVIGLVAVGVFFSAWQFRQAMRVSEGTEDNDRPEPEASTLEISPNGLKVTSNVLGVIILALSLGFFYLYLKYVYEIQEIL